LIEKFESLSRREEQGQKKKTRKEMIIRDKTRRGALWSRQEAISIRDGLLDAFHPRFPKAKRWLKRNPESKTQVLKKSRVPIDADKRIQRKLSRHHQLPLRDRRPFRILES